jgi:DNA polymerase III alpha subunit
VRVAGCVIAGNDRGLPKGFVFLSLEDETGIANIIVTPDVLDRYRATIIQGKFLLFEGPLQNVGQRYSRESDSRGGNHNPACCTAFAGFPLNTPKACEGE